MSKFKLKSDLNTPEVREALERWVSVWGDEDSSGGGVTRCLLRAIRAPEPLEPPIPWKYIDKKYQWVAMDFDNVWYAFTKRPEISGINWLAKYGEYGELCCPEGSDRHWTETLIERPDDE